MPNGYALITGASSGIGAALARALGGEGRDLVLTARAQDRLDQLAAEVRACGRDVHVVAADLATAAGVERIESYLAGAGLTVDLLVNNAGFGSGGDFSQLTAERELEMLAVNCRSLVALTHRHLGRMRARGRGAIVNVASVAAFQPVPYLTTYSATKAFVLHFSLALWEENRDSGVHVMALCPGTTRTGFFAAAGFDGDTPYSQSPEQVANLALAGLRRRRPLVVCGWPNRVMVAAERLLPRRWILAGAARYMRSRTIRA